MATLTTNLFWGQGERDHRLEVVEGTWPDDVHGSVFVIGPDKRRPGGHWFAEHGLLERIRLRPDAEGRIEVRHRLVDTRLARLRRRFGALFRKVQFMELSPFGVTNLANTGVQPVGDRLLVGYDAGRPVEVDPEQMRCVTAVGANDEWLQAVPAPLEPMIAVAAHPAVDLEERTAYFVNYAQVSPPGEPAETHLARWDLEGPVQRWRLRGMSEFDSIHDLKVSERHVVISDLPFVVEPASLRGAQRTQRNQQHTNLWIVPIAALERTEPGGDVEVTEVRLPLPTGHLFVDHDEADGCVRVTAQHMPLADLMVSIDRDTLDHRNGVPIDPNYEGMVALGLQPTVIGRYLIDTASGRIIEAELAHDDDVWGGVLCSTDTRPGARAHHRQLWCAGVGFDPDLVPEPWWRLYGDATDGLVAPDQLPDRVVPASLARVDLDAMKVAELWSFEPGSFASPPTFVSRTGSDRPDDGYVVVVVHRDGPKEVQVFDAQRIAEGPIARASSPTFNPPLLLHSAWMPPSDGARRSDYRVRLRDDLRGAVRGAGAATRRLLRAGAAMRRAERAQRSSAEVVR